MLNEHGLAFEYREYSTNPLTLAELKAVFQKLAVTPATLLRKNDAAYKLFEWTGKESDSVVLKRMATHPTLLQRPIGVKGAKAVVGRPV